ncbi:MAG: DUF1217 domain-containing protein [Hyphomonadaceae bacterium]|nr:DUF1217 domain-containing protein [Hyphomonadaceae bacterium]
MQINATLLSYLFPSTSSGGADTLLAIVQGRTADGVSTTARQDPLAVLADAEKNADKQIAAKTQEPAIRREIEAFVKGVVAATSVEDLLSNAQAVKVILTANGLEEFAGYRGLYTKALTSDPESADGLAVRLSETNVAWLNTAKTYQFFERGLEVIQSSNTIEAIANAYAEVRWRESLDAKAPGVSAALSFKAMAANIDSPFKILGDAVAREVVTTAYAIPAQIAYQSLEAQSLAITSRLDIANFQKPEFVDALARRYLIMLNSSGGGVTV